MFYYQYVLNYSILLYLHIRLQHDLQPLFLVQYIVTVQAQWSLWSRSRVYYGRISGYNWVLMGTSMGINSIDSFHFTKLSLSATVPWDRRRLHPSGTQYVALCTNLRSKDDPQFQLQRYELIIENSHPRSGTICMRNQVEVGGTIWNYFVSLTGLPIKKTKVKVVPPSYPGLVLNTSTRFRPVPPTSTKFCLLRLVHSV